jgi:DNA-binding MarR family transcriptional regulator
MPSHEPPDHPVDPLVHRAAEALLDNVSLLTRRLRQRPVSGELTQPESGTLSRLSREAPTTVAELARAETIRPQSMGAVVGSLEARGLVKRHRDRTDGRRVLLTVTRAGREVAERKGTARGAQLADALASDFTEEELEQLVAVAPLLGRLAGRLDQRSSGPVS